MSLGSNQSKSVGRGAARNVDNPFEAVHFRPDPELTGDGRLSTVVLHDETKSIVSENKSPDIPFRYSVNPYRGCEHGCSYCYARPTHQYLGFSAGLDFETKILVKKDSPELLRSWLRRRGYRPEPVMLSGVTDPYQPQEAKLRVTESILDVFWEHRHPVSIITKNALVLRDLDKLTRMADANLVHVAISMTTLNAKLARKLEPRTSTPAARLRAIRELSQAGVPVRIMTAPVIPGLNDHEVPDLLKAAASAGAKNAGYVMLRLSDTVKDVFLDWLHTTVPDRAEKVIAAIRSVRQGGLNDTKFRDRMRGRGERADQIAALFKVTASKLGLQSDSQPLDCTQFRVPGSPKQLDLF
ncbi:MAG: PA0069 family radical SAM protein [Planctomycetota bacterium]